MDFSEYTDKEQTKEIKLANKSFTVLDGGQLKLFKNLKELSIHFTELSQLPPEIKGLTQLQKLDLYGNKLTSLPSEIGGLTQLQTFRLSGNLLTSLPPEIGELSQLQVLGLSHNQLTSLPGSILNLQNSLVLLNLIGNPIVETGTDGNLGRRELSALFGDRIIFGGVQQPSDFKKITKEDAIRNVLAQPLHWNLEKLKLLINNRVPSSEYTEQQMLEAWTGSFAPLIVKENNELMANYIKKLYNPDMEYKRWPMEQKFIPMTKDLLEAVFKECLKVDSRQDKSKQDKEAIIRSNLSAICTGIKHCPDRQISELRFAYGVLKGNEQNEELTLKQMVEQSLAAIKERIFDNVFTPGASSQNVHVMTYWKKRLGPDLGFDFNFETNIGTMGQDPYHGEPGNALEAFFSGFTPNVVMSLLLDEINDKGSFLCRAAEYIYESEENESIKRTWCEMNDEEFLETTKVTRAFVEHYLLRMGILERA